MIAAMGLRGCGNRELGEWQDGGSETGLWHIKRRLTAMETIEMARFGVPGLVDVRGTDEQVRRLAVVKAEVSPETWAAIERRPAVVASRARFGENGA